MHCWGLPVLCLLTLFGSHAASLTLPNQSASPGQTVVFTLSFAAQGQSISSLQFDIDADPGLSFGTLPGMQIGASGKALYTASLSDHSLRILLAGINSQQIGDGELLRPVVVVDPGAFPGTAQIRIQNIVAADQNGSTVAISSTAATVQIQAGSPAQPFAAGTVVNAGSLLAGAVSPGEIVTIFGGAGLAAASDVRFNGASAPILYAGTGQINAIVPFGLDPTKAANLEILTPTGSLGALTLSAAAVSPALFTQSSTGLGPAAILNQDYSLNSYSNPAPLGSTVMMYGTGFGSVVPPLADGQTATAAAPTALPVTATIGGVAAKVTYAGAAPFLVAGVVQVNVKIPGDLQPGPAVPISLSIGSVATAPGITIALQ